jgi:hypothetical protein
LPFSSFFSLLACSSWSPPLPPEIRSSPLGPPPAAGEFGFPLLPPSKLNRSDLTHGANFAITGATALDTPYFEARGLGAVVWNSGALMTQIQWFRDLKPFFCNSTKGN